METAITILIYIHAIFGGIALLAGGAGMILPKGSRTHKISGKWFSISMLTSVFISLAISRMPGHFNNFLFAIGLFTAYMIFAGTRALSFKGGKKPKPDWKDLMLSTVMLLVSSWMIVQGIVDSWVLSQANFLFVFFGAIGLFLSLADLRNYRKMAKDRSLWLKSHIGRMVGAYIASVTAFIIAGLHLNSTVFWIAPTILGTFYIVYWSRKVSGGRSVLNG